MALDPPAPARVPDEPLPRRGSPSVIDLPVRFDLGVLLGTVEENLPTRWVEEDVPVGEGDATADIAFTRGPFAASFQGDTVSLSATVAYALRTSVDLPLLPDPQVSCGPGDDGLAPRMDVAIHGRLGLAADWTLTSSAGAVAVEPTSTAERDRCEVSVFGIDVTERVGTGIRSYLSDNRAVIDSLVGEVDVSSELEEWWETIANPIELDRDRWLTIRPESVSRASIEGRGDEVTIHTRVVARPTIVFGPRPSAPGTPLPPLAPGTGTPGFVSAVDVFADYAEISQVIADELRDARFTGAGREIRVADVSVTGRGGGEVVVRLRIRGDVNGTLYLVGSPEYVANDGLVRIPDLSIAVTTSDLLVAGASWILDAGVESLLRDRVRWPVAGGISLAQSWLEKGINTDLSSDVRLRGSISSLSVEDIVARRSGLLVRLTAAGDLELHVGEVR